MGVPFTNREGKIGNGRRYLNFRRVELEVSLEHLNRND